MDELVPARVQGEEEDDNSNDSDHAGPTHTKISGGMSYTYDSRGRFLKANFLRSDGPDAHSVLDPSAHEEEEEEEVDDEEISKIGEDALRRSLLDFQLQEEEALNRAIYMSLQNKVSIASPSEANITALLTMGFSREDAVASLTRTGDDLDQAINNLLGA